MAAVTDIVTARSGWRDDFPALRQMVHGKPLVYLDSAASAQKPHAVIEAMTHFMRHDYANVHRGVHSLSQRATMAFEALRPAVASLINAPGCDNIVITHSATEAFNLVMHGLGRAHFTAGDEIILSEMEHHANIVPWQMLAAEKNVVIKVAPILADGTLDLDALEKLFSPRTRLLSITHASNVLGTVNPVKKLAALAHERNVPVLFDGSQAVVHGPVDVQDIGADLYIFTGHKLYGPTGIGILYGTSDILEKMAPFQGGGDMIEQVRFSGTTYKKAPQRFEAGTPPIIEAVGLKTAIDYVQNIGMQAIHDHEQLLLAAATAGLSTIPGLKIHGTAPGKSAIISFTIDGLHPHDVATLLDRYGVAVRVGKHCAEPLMDRLGLSASIRASFGLYNNAQDVTALVTSVIKACDMLR